MLWCERRHVEEVLVPGARFILAVALAADIACLVSAFCVRVVVASKVLVQWRGQGQMHAIDKPLVRWRRRGWVRTAGKVE